MQNENACHQRAAPEISLAHQHLLTTMNVNIKYGTLTETEWEQKRNRTKHHRQIELNRQTVRKSTLENTWNLWLCCQTIRNSEFRIAIRWLIFHQISQNIEFNGCTWHPKICYFAWKPFNNTNRICYTNDCHD